MIEINSPAWKLSGMEYAGGMYSAKEWEEKTGVNPLNYPNYFKVSGGFCYVTDKFRRDYKIASEYKRQMGAMLTS